MTKNIHLIADWGFRIKNRESLRSINHKIKMSYTSGVGLCADHMLVFAINCTRRALRPTLL